HLVLRLSALLLAYALTWQEAPHFSSYLAGKALVPGVLAWPVAGLVLFIGGSFVFSVLARGLMHVAPEHWQHGGKKSGAFLGAVLGCAVSVLLVWTVGTLRDAWALRTAQDNQTPVVAKTVTVPTVVGVQQADTAVRNLSGEAMAVLAHRALGDTPVAQATTQWIREPVSVSAGLQRLASKPELRLLFQDPASYAVLVRGSVSDVQNLPQFQMVTDDAEAMQFLSAVGLPGETAQEESQALAGMLSRYARRFETLRSTPEFQSLAQDPELREKLQQGNLIALLTNDKMRRLAEMLAQDDAGAKDALPAAATLLDRAQQLADAGQSVIVRPASTKSQAQEPSKPLYRWKDSNGRMHITEEKPPEGVKVDVIQP
ncbi:MAG TPA: DUF4124 domain-containing protein, partial [Pseudomonadales bacterium]|nr:DUF4124 domain-containing protein [Pseudomonadales bacterium]